MFDSQISQRISLMPAPALHQITAIPGRGNALVATRLILKGELIFTEKPSMWHSRSTSEGFCSSCGKLIIKLPVPVEGIPATLPLLLIRCNHFRDRCKDSVTGRMNDGISNCCTASYCSTDCRDEAERSGHRWLCGESFVKRFKVTQQITLICLCKMIWS